MDPGAYTCAINFTLKGDKAPVAADTEIIAKPELYFRNFLFEAQVIGYASIMHRIVMRERVGYTIPQFDDHAGKMQTMVISSYSAVNRKGKVVKDSLNGRIIEKFDKKGNLVSKASFNAKGVITRLTEYGYNKAGYLITESARRGNGELYRKQTFKYNDQGKKVEEINYNPTNDSLYNRIVFAYNNKGAIMLQAAHNAKRGIQYLTLYKYDTNNKPSAQITYDSDMKPSRRKIFRYTGADQMEEVEYSAEDSLNYRDVYSYDSKHRIIKTDGYNNEGKFQSSNSYAYDAKGNKTEEVLDKTANYPGIKSNFAYGAYDKHGNWHSVKWTSGYLSKSYIVERRIVY
jgi:hypothetical protein